MVIRPAQQWWLRSVASGSVLGILLWYFYHRDVLANVRNRDEKQVALIAELGRQGMSIIQAAYNVMAKQGAPVLGVLHETSECDLPTKLLRYERTLFDITLFLGEPQRYLDIGYVARCTDINQLWRFPENANLDAASMWCASLRLHMEGLDNVIACLFDTEAAHEIVGGRATAITRAWKQTPREGIICTWKETHVIRLYENVQYKIATTALSQTVQLCEAREFLALDILGKMLQALHNSGGIGPMRLNDIMRKCHDYVAKRNVR